VHVYREYDTVLEMSSSVRKVVRTPDILIPSSEMDANTDLMVGSLERV